MGEVTHNVGFPSFELRELPQSFLRENDFILQEFASGLWGDPLFDIGCSN